VDTRRFLRALVAAAFLASSPATGAEVAVRHAEGVLHGFLALRDLSGNRLADGDLIQTTHGGQVTARLVFHFRDGSLQEETAVFSQKGAFRLVRDHLVQRGPSFKKAQDTSIEVADGQVTVRSADDGGKETVETKHFDLPADLANGLMLTLIKNIDPGRSEPTTVSMVAAASSPRLVHVVVTRDGEDIFAVGGSSRRAVRYRARVDIGGIAGVAAKLLGKQPPDTLVWVLPGEAPAFVKSEGPLYFGGPIWRIELTSPSWRDKAPPAK
jgi:hypothetical protein